MLRRLLDTGVAGGGLLGVLMAAGWVGAVTLLGTVVVATAALCWILRDRDMPRRLEGIIRAWRESSRGAAAPRALPRGLPPVRRKSGRPTCRNHTKPWH